MSCICIFCGYFYYELDNSPINNVPNDKKYLISSHIKTYSNSKAHLRVTNEIIQTAIAKEPTVQEKILIFLRYFASRSKHPGDYVTISSSTDYFILFCRNENEANYFLEYLHKNDCLEKAKHIAPIQYSLTITGWNYFLEHSSLPSSSNQCFIAMWFDVSMEEAKTKGIIPAIEKAGYIAQVINMKPHNNKICEEILFEIKNSKFLIADVTGSRGGVYFEAGYAKALGKEVIWSCREDKLKDDAHFDTRQYNHVIWKSPEDLYDKLYNQIIGTIGFGTYKNG